MKETSFQSTQAGSPALTRLLHTEWAALFYLLLVVTAESLVAFGSPLVGLALHCLVLVALLLHSSLAYQHHQSRFLLTLSLAPLIRLISLLAPIGLFEKIYWFPVVGIPLLAAAYLISRSGGISRQRIGLVAAALPLQLLVGLLGVVLGYFEYLILRPAPLVPALRLELIWFPALVLILFTGFTEELVFRGLMQATALPYLRLYGIPYVAVVFASLHIGYGSAADLLFVFTVALLFGYVTQRSGSILGVSLAHGLINVMLFLILPFILGSPAAAQSSLPPEPVQGSLANLAAGEVSATPTWLQIIPATSTYTLTPSPTSMPHTPTALSTATPIQTLLPSPSPSMLADNCPSDYPTQLQAGQVAVAMVALNVRKDPGLDQDILLTSPRGDRMKIIGGPVCVPHGRRLFRWWKVQLEIGITGWSAEGEQTNGLTFLSLLP